MSKRKAIQLMAVLICCFASPIFVNAFPYTLEYIPLPDDELAFSDFHADALRMIWRSDDFASSGLLYWEVLAADNSMIASGSGNIVAGQSYPGGPYELQYGTLSNWDNHFQSTGGTWEVYTPLADFGIGSRVYYIFGFNPTPANEYLTEIEFAVTESAQTPIPEPNSSVLVIIGILILFLFKLIRKMTFDNF